MRFIFVFFILSSLGFSQQNAVEYLQLVEKDQEQILAQTWDYLQSLARSGSNAKINQRRYELNDAVQKASERVQEIPDYKGNTSYRDSMVDYLEFSLDVIQGKTDDLIDLEKISKHSYDAMESYILYKQQLNQKLQEKNEAIQIQQKIFAAENEVELLESKNQIVEKISEASKIFDYRDWMYLSFFRCAVYEDYLLDALQGKSKDVDYQLLALTVYNLAEESKANMDTIQDVNSDLSLRKATEKALAFFTEEAQTLTPLVVQYNKMNNEFEAFKVRFNQEERTKENVETYNNWVEKLNEASQKLNRAFNEFNLKRSEIFNGWNSTSDRFIQKHVPQ